MKEKMGISAPRLDCANTNGSRRFPMVCLVIPKAEHYVSDLPCLEALPLGKQAVSLLKSISRSLRKPHFKFLFRRAKRQGKPKCFCYFGTLFWHHLPFCSGYHSQLSVSLHRLRPQPPKAVSHFKCQLQTPSCSTRFLPTRSIWSSYD